MTLIIGGASQGKLDYVLRKTGYTPGQVAHTPEEAMTRPVFDGLEQWPDLDEEKLLSANPDLILICDEVGCGVVPLDPEEERYREAVGRLCCALAAEADAVVRVIAGVPQYIKGGTTCI